MNNDELEIIGDIHQNLGTGDNASSPRAYVSPAVIKRLPRYFRYLRELIRNGKMRISSGELSKIMNVTASQIRQDLNCFGGFGQQGYGYNVKYLYAKISEILGVNCNFRAIIVGAGNLGRALVRNPMFTKRGVSTVAMFDIDENLIGGTVAGVTVHSMDELENFCKENSIDIAVLTLPKECAQDTTEKLVRAGVCGIWNFTGKELEMNREDIKVVNVHLGDSLMTLCYELNLRREKKEDN
ncbi:MAG: redox-sensing transcriptional repressor Rex [Clostridia bacterium]|nr:redox-sensing transcriptional repressor Rex [Clostridia bacterium]